MTAPFFQTLDRKVSTLRGVGPAMEKGFHNLDIYTAGDLLSLSPRAREDRTQIKSVDQSGEGEFCNTKVMVCFKDFFGRGRKRTLRITVKDLEGQRLSLSLICFNRPFLAKTIQDGKIYSLYGQIQFYRGQRQCSLFELLPPEDPKNRSIIPIYPLRQPLTQKVICRAVKQVLSETEKFHEELSEEIRNRYHLLSTDEAIRNFHLPENRQKMHKAERTLAFGELFYLFLLTARKKRIKSTGKKRSAEPSSLELKCLKALPFSLTRDQMTSLKEIREDLDSPYPMHRLLQGDVGSGKTLIAWISALHEISKKRQVAFMAPTELLARQHADNAKRLLAPLGVSVAYITGSMSRKEREKVQKSVEENRADIIIGTHALFSKELRFKNLGYVIIDEQHRFGVEQRFALSRKGKEPHILSMTATPIPRTLCLTVFGDLDISTLKTMPPNRIPVTTYLVLDRHREKMYRSIGYEFDRGHKAYFVYPRISDEKESDLRSVNEMFTFLKKTYPGVPSAMIHSKLDEGEKMRILTDFREGRISYLVSTSVVEVGIDVPDATVMVIEHANRFGLAALHQLRGRVGRSSLPSYCFLVFPEELTDDAKKRLRAMKESTDGFYLAEQDLQIRGPGDITGIKQSGFIDLKFASLTGDLTLIQETKDAVQQLLEEDPGLLKAENAPVRETLSRYPFISQ